MTELATEQQKLAIETVSQVLRIPVCMLLRSALPHTDMYSIDELTYEEAVQVIKYNNLITEWFRNKA